MNRTLLLCLAILGALNSGLAQIDTAYIGNATNTNTNTSYPAPYGNYYDGSRQQYLYLASELQAAGMSAGDIQALAFNVSAVGTNNEFQNLEVSIGTTPAVQLQNLFNQDPLTQVISEATIQEVVGWNNHTFSTPFAWDGTSNILIQICHQSGQWSGNATHYTHTTTFNSATIFVEDGNPQVCQEWFGNQNQPNDERPDIRFIFEVPIPDPVADFSASTSSSCSGIVSFSDLTTNDPDSWQWDFGDGNTDTVQNPTHTYTVDGTYDVTLIATNQFNSDTITYNSVVTVTLNGNTPIAPDCVPNTTDGTLGFGITNFELNTINNGSSNASVGYEDFTCQSTTLYRGQKYEVTVNHGSPSTHNCGIWIDFDNDGAFTSNGEYVVSSTNSGITEDTITIPVWAVLDTPLRLRVSADYDLAAAPTSCDDLQYGQAEDYTVIIEIDSTPPVANFTVNDTLTCSGEIDFTDISSNAPYAWNWDFGDGNTSLNQSPSHTYTADGYYNVQLVAFNLFGQDTIIQNSIIHVTLGNAVTEASCTPQTLAYCCDYGIFNVNLESINHSTGNAEEGYQDFTCSQRTNLEQEGTFTLSVTTGPSNPQDTKAWIDFNNDGQFDDATELIMDQLNTSNPSQSFVVPNTSVDSVPLRMRIVSEEIGAGINSCDDLTRGQTEDYGIFITMPDTTDGINEIEELTALIYPNPADNVLNIQAAEQITGIQLYNILGAVVMNETTLASDRHQLDISTIQPGTYIVVITSITGIKAQKRLLIK